MLTPQIMSLFRIQRPRPRRFPFYGQKHVRSIQRDPITGAAHRDPADGALLNTTNAAGTEQQCCCGSGPCKCKNEDGSSGALHDTLLVHISGFAVPTVCCYFITNTPTSGFTDFQTAVKYVSLPLNGTFCFARDGASCLYTATVPVEINAFGPQSLADCADCGDSYSSNVFTVTELNLYASINGGSSAGLISLLSFYATPAGMSEAEFVRLRVYYGLYNPLFWYAPVDEPTPIPCNSSIEITNQAAWFAGVEVDDAFTGRPGVWYAPPNSIIPRSGFGPNCKLVTAGISGPHPGTPFGGTIQVADASCP